MRNLLLPLIAVLASACVSPAPRKPVLVVWEDDDRHPIEEPKEYYSGLMWDGADKMVFRQISQALILDDFGPAKNVNVYGEVPNSSWYTNRLSLTEMSGERIAQGPCEKDIDTDAVWLVKSGKVDGANPGFVIEDTSDGRRYLMKFDSFQQLPERATAADVIIQAAERKPEVARRLEKIQEKQRDEAKRRAEIEGSSKGRKSGNDAAARNAMPAAPDFGDGASGKQKRQMLGEHL